MSVSSFLSMCYMVRRGITLWTIARSARFVLLTIGFTLSVSVWGIESSVGVKLLVDVLYGKTRHHSLADRSHCVFRIAHNRLCPFAPCLFQFGGSSRVSVPRAQGSSQQLSGQGQGFASRCYGEPRHHSLDCRSRCSFHITNNHSDLSHPICFGLKDQVGCRCQMSQDQVSSCRVKVKGSRHQGAMVSRDITLSLSLLSFTLLVCVLLTLA